MYVPPKIHILPMFLILIVTGITALLVYETGSFINSILSGDMGYWYAAVIEIIGLVLIEILCLTKAPSDWHEWLYRKSMIVILIAVFVLMAGSSGLYSIQPILSRDNISSLEKTKLAEYNKIINNQTAILDSVKGQKKNTAWRSQQLAKTLEKKEALVANMKPDAGMAKAGHATIILMILLRVILQSGNWIIAGLAGKLIRAKLEPVKGEPLTIPAIRQPEPVQIIYEEVTLGKTKPREFVLNYYPDASAKKNDEGLYEIRVNGSEILGTAKNSPLAWNNARENLGRN